MDKVLWWHVYNGVVDDVKWGDNLDCTYTIGGSITIPESMPQHLKNIPWLTYRGSFDHEPTEEEKKALPASERRMNE